MHINWIMELFDTIASILGKYGSWLNAKGRKICFIVWSLCIIYWFFRDIQLEMYSRAISCIVSLGINIYGYINWSKKNDNYKIHYANT